METTLQSANRALDEIRETQDAELVEAEAHHIHLPGPSYWPLILGAAILVTTVGLLFVPETPWLAIVGAPLILVGIIGWALEDPMAHPRIEETDEPAYVYDPKLTPQQVRERAEAVADKTVTVGSTAYSTHPVKVEIDAVKENGVILALYGRIELVAQSRMLEERLRELPNVLDIRNFIVAEDTILEITNARLEKLYASGKLEGAKDIHVLVENYILNLYGEVPTTEMRQALEREVIGIPGVRVVVNHIGLNKEIPGNLGRTRNKI